MKTSYKVFLIFGLSVLCCSVTSAQDSVAVSRTATGQITSFNAVEGPGAKAIVGAPYSADSETEISQTLADGTHINRKTGMTRMFRDSQGRTRREGYAPANMQTGEAGSLVMVTIEDPVAGVEYILSPRDRTARQVDPGASLHVTTGANGGMTVQSLQPRIATSGNGPVTAAAPPAPARQTNTSEDLGTQTIEGLVVDGKRFTHTIPVGAEGNDRPMEIVHEMWFSNDLRITVLSKTSSPQSGETTTRVTNIVRAEPDSALFQVPPDYTITQQQ